VGTLTELAADKQASRVDVLKQGPGVLEVWQLHVMEDARSGITGLAVPHSGFQKRQEVTTPRTEVLPNGQIQTRATIITTTEPKDVEVEGQHSARGRAAIKQVEQDV
jgi:hypothetical protein